MVIELMLSECSMVGVFRVKGPWSSSISIIWEFVGNANSYAHPDQPWPVLIRFSKYSSWSHRHLRDSRRSIKEQSLRSELGGPSFKLPKSPGDVTSSRWRRNVRQFHVWRVPENSFIDCPSWYTLACFSLRLSSPSSGEIWKPAAQSVRNRFLHFP